MNKTLRVFRQVVESEVTPAPGGATSTGQPLEGCNISNETQPSDPLGFGLGNEFGGIPQTLCINFFVAGILMIVFLVLRRRGWGSSKFHKTEITAVLYGNRAALQPSDSDEKAHDLEKRGRAPSEDHDEDAVPARDSEGSDALTIRQWFKNALMAQDDFLIERSGTAALEYLRFQRHVIVFTAVLCVVSIGIILPVNYRGTKQVNMNATFPRTTINNIDPDKDPLWVHMAFTMLLFPAGLLAMLSYGMKFELSKGLKKKVKTLMFDGLEARVATEEKIRQHFEEAFPDIQVTAVYLTLDVTKLQNLDYELNTVTAALQFYEKTMPNRKDRPQVKDVCCGYCCGCFVEGVDAVEYYQKRRDELEKKIVEQVQVWKKTNTIFFVSFGGEDQAYAVHKAYRLFFQKKPKTSVSGTIGAKNWTSRLAPSAPFVAWENLSISGPRWWIRSTLFNVALILFFIFASSPPFILSASKDFAKKHKWMEKYTPPVWASSYISSLFLVTCWALIPLLMYYMVQWTGYHTRSKEMRAEMKLIYAYLIIGILVFPTLTLTSGNSIIERITKGDDIGIRWDCAFLPDQGAIFANLLSTWALLGAAFNLLRVGQLVVLLFRYCCGSRSEAERNIVTKSKNLFYFNSMYPDFLLSFTVAAVYSLICPIVTPIGLLAMCTRYMVDRYNLSYVCGKSEAPTSVHASAVNFFLVGILMQNLLMIFFFVLRGGVRLGPKSVLLIAVMVINGVLYIGISWFGLLKKVSLDDEYTEDDIDSPGQSPPVGTPVKRSRSIYIPPVLQRFESRHMSPSIEPSVSGTP